MNQSADHEIVKEPKGKPPKSKWTQLLLGLIFGIAFGFLLQKGGAAKYHILVGVLLLEDWTVIQIMLSAIVVGMVGLFPLAAWGWVELKPKPTRYAANVIGGLLFGVASRCRPTARAQRRRAGPGQLRRARRHGRHDRRFVGLRRNVRLDRPPHRPLGNRGTLTFIDVFGHRTATVATAAILLAGVAAAFHWVPTL